MKVNRKVPSFIHLIYTRPLIWHPGKGVPCWGSPWISRLFFRFFNKWSSIPGILHSQFKRFVLTFYIAYLDISHAWWGIIAYRKKAEDRCWCIPRLSWISCQGSSMDPWAKVPSKLQVKVTGKSTLQKKEPCLWGCTCSFRCVGRSGCLYSLWDMGVYTVSEIFHLAGNTVLLQSFYSILILSFT